VTKEEFEGDSYPPYCAGWAYVTNLNAIKLVLLKAEQSQR